MDLSTTSPQHPVVACVEEVRGALDRVAGANPVFLSSEQKAAVLVELARQEARLAALKLKVLAAADDVALDAGARSAGAWLAHRTLVDIGPALAAERLAAALDGRWVQVAEALADGRVNEPQATVIVRALEELPADLDPELLNKAEGHLIAEAAHFEPRRLRVLGRRILEVVAPDLAEEHERRQLEAEEARARRLTQLTMRRRGDGTTEIHARVADAVAGRLKTYLDAYAAPRRHDTSQRGTQAQEWGYAFGAMLEAVPSDRLPQHGGASTTVVVTVDQDWLTDRLAAAGLDTGERISAGEAMRLACTSKILPAVLDGAGQPLHLGRARRLFSSGQQMAMAIRDRECRAAGCSIPATWCEAHHLRPWATGGRTDIDDGILLCPWHHHRVHDPTYATDRLPNGDVRFHRRR